MDIIKEFPFIYNRACTDFKDRNIKNNAWVKVPELLDLEESKRRQTYDPKEVTLCLIGATRKTVCGNDHNCLVFSNIL